MTLLNLIFAIVLAYLIGSVPTAVWVGRAFYGVDVRQMGSKNAGATNTMRVLGLKAGIPVLLVDIAKGFVAVSIAGFFVKPDFDSSQMLIFRMVLGLVTILGHIFPVYVGFKGGKGVATVVGVLLALLPGSLGVTAIVFALVFILFRYVSLASILSAISFPLIVLFVFHVQEKPLIILAILVGVFIPLTHWKNIKRLVGGEEKKFVVQKKVHQ